MTYINTATQAQASESEIRSLFSNTSFPVPFVPPEGYAFVFPTPQPAHDAVTQTVRKIASELTALGTWEQRWEVVELFDVQADKDAAIAADARDKALALQKAVVDATQDRLDKFAQTRGYDSILSAATYAASGVPKFAAEGQCAVNVRDATWAELYTVLADVQAGRRPMPKGFDDIELPVLEWPA